MRLEETLQRHEKRRAIVTVPIGVASWHNLGIIDLYLHLRIPRQRTVKRVEQQIAVKAVAGRHHAVKFQLEVLVFVESGFHRRLRGLEEASLLACDGGVKHAKLKT